MEFIRKIEIKHFRSIFDVEIDQMSHVNVFSGMNDVGKSNVLKALNLFFWDETDWETRLWAHRDLNAMHETVSAYSGEDCAISVKVYFAAPGRSYQDLLPDGFWIERCWNSIGQSHIPDTAFGLPNQHIPNEQQHEAIHQILESCRFLYIPAVRDRQLVNYLLDQVTHNFSHDADDFRDRLTEYLEESIDKRVPELSELLRNSTGIGLDLRTSFSVNIDFDSAELFADDNIPLHLRGDGMKNMVVPAILEFFTRRFSRTGFVLWAIEEPENSLEYRRASKLATQLLREYSAHSQIFLTTHSPAFLDMQDERASVYRVSQEEKEVPFSGHREMVTAVEPVMIKGHEVDSNILPEELGFLEIARRFNREIRGLFDYRDAEISRLKQRVSELTEPTLIVEGKHDIQTLQHAWRRLYEVPIPFDIIEMNGENGVGDLVTLLIHMPNGRKNAALLDHDHAGIVIYDRLKKACNGQNISTLGFNRVESDDLMFMTLPPPSKPYRSDQAINKNLSMEFYFNDDFLIEIDRRSGNQLFQRNKWIRDGKHIDLDEDSLMTLFDIGKKSMIHRALNNKESAKKEVVKALTELDVVDFLSFHPLLEIIVKHLKPGFALPLKPSVTAVHYE